MSKRCINITQGEYTILGDSDVCVTTLLGSCVACCLWDSLAEVGGMNHMLLAHRNTTSTQSTLAGINAMEVLINGLLRRGARRDRLVAKVFGGAEMRSGQSKVGDINGQFTLDFLKRENIACIGQSLGGTQARQLVFWPTQGKAQMKFVPRGEEQTLMPAPVIFNGVELL